jgi:hypothetical protein
MAVGDVVVNPKKKGTVGRFLSSACCHCVHLVVPVFFIPWKQECMEHRLLYDNEESY